MVRHEEHNGMYCLPSYHAQHVLQSKIEQWLIATCLERGSSAIERRTRNQETLGSNPSLLPIQSLGIFVLSMMPQFTQLYNKYLAIDGSRNVSEYSLRVIAAWLECFQEKPTWCRNEQVCQGRQKVYKAL